MSEALNNALWITGIGMGLVFLAILILWALMESLVRFWPDQDKRINAEEEIHSAIPSPENMQQEWENKKKAAALAVSVALALQKGSSENVYGRGQDLSPWQSAMRINRFHQKSGRQRS